MNKTLKKIIKALIGVIIVLLLVWEWQNMYIDIYNFQQLKIVKSILDPLDKESYSFSTIYDFNKKYDNALNPIKYCYYISERNGYFNNWEWGGGYIFGVKLHSLTYRIFYWTSDYAYPKYDLPPMYICDGTPWCTADGNKNIFRYTISNKCNPHLK